MYKIKRMQKHKKIRKDISGTQDRPRLAVFKSSQHIYAQIIDDTQNKTLVDASDLKIKNGKKSDKASMVGEELAKKAVKRNLKKVVFDRGGFRYHGRIMALAEAARKGGLEF
ncbi:50S ribosomal protein L18 [Candidatus Daviesbacteria bacterium]|nr:50S ribosomal protein L18 [Candidatus Daviesbacteria bacterium]